MAVRRVQAPDHNADVLTNDGKLRPDFFEKNKNLVDSHNKLQDTVATNKSSADTSIAGLQASTDALQTAVTALQSAVAGVAGSATYDPPSLADGVGTTTTIACPGAALGGMAQAAFSLDLQGITLTAWVSAANVVSVRFQNESGGVLDLASGTLTVRVR